MHPITSEDVQEFLQKSAEKSLFDIKPSSKVIKPFSMNAIKSVEPPSFSVSPPADVQPREDAMKRKA